MQTKYICKIFLLLVSTSILFSCASPGKEFKTVLNSYRETKALDNVQFKNIVLDSFQIRYKPHFFPRVPRVSVQRKAFVPLLFVNYYTYTVVGSLSHKNFKNTIEKMLYLIFLTRLQSNKYIDTFLKNGGKVVINIDKMRAEGMYKYMRQNFMILVNTKKWKNIIKSSISGNIEIYKDGVLVSSRGLYSENHSYDSEVGKKNKIYRVPDNINSNMWVTIRKAVTDVSMYLENQILTKNLLPHPL